MHPSTEISIDLTAQELLTPPAPTGMIEVDDICDIDPLRAPLAVANVPHGCPMRAARNRVNDSVEIELTAEQIDADATPQPARRIQRRLHVRLAGILAHQLGDDRIDRHLRIRHRLVRHAPFRDAFPDQLLLLRIDDIDVDRADLVRDGAVLSYIGQALYSP